MKSIKFLAAMSAAVCLICCSARLSAQGPAAAADGHKVFAMDVGTWQVSGKMWMPGADEPMSFEATEVNKMLGEVHVISDFQGEFSGIPFQGHGTASFDAESNVYITTWVDVMDASLYINKGTWDEKTETLTLEGEKKGPDGTPVKSKSTMEYKKDGTRVLTMFSAADGGDWHKEMELVYTKKSDDE